MKKALDAYKAEVAETNGGEEPVVAKMDVDEDASKSSKKKRKSLAADETVSSSSRISSDCPFLFGNEASAAPSSVD